MERLFGASTAIIDSPDATLLEFWQLPFDVTAVATGLFTAMFLFLLFVAMPLFDTWNKLLAWQKIEWIMRCGAVVNSSVSLYMSVDCLLFHPHYERIVPFRHMVGIMAGYWTYDIIGNVLYYRLLGKNFVLVHHLISLYFALTVLMGGLATATFMGVLSMALTDLPDHLCWFIQRCGFQIKTILRFNSYWFGFVRFVIFHWGMYHFLQTDPTFLPFSFQYKALYCAIVVYALMNFYVFSTRMAVKGTDCSQVNVAVLDSKPKDMISEPNFTNARMFQKHNALGSPPPKRIARKVVSGDAPSQPKLVD